MNLEAPDGLANALRGVERHLAGPADEHRWWVRADDGTRGLVTVVPGSVPGGSAEVRRRVAAVTRLRHEHVAGLGPVLRLPGDAAGVLEQPVEGHDLATVRAARGAWAPGEVVTLLAPLSGAVAALHEAGLTHEVTPRNVVLTPDGRAVLVGLAAPGGVLAPEGDRARRRTAADDVVALARIGLDLLEEPSGPTTSRGARRRSARPDPAERLGHLDRARGSGPPEGDGPREAAERARVWQVLSLASRAAGGDRPTATRLAAELYRACPPVPVEQPDAAVLAGLALRRPAAAAPGRDRGRHRRPTRPGRRWLEVAAASLAIAVCGVTVAATVTGATTEDATSREDPVDAAVALTRARAEALVAGDLAALRQVTVPGSPAALGDEAAARQALGLGLVGGTSTTRIELVEELPPAGGTGSADVEGCSGCARVHLRSAVTAVPAEDAGADQALSPVPTAPGGAGEGAAPAVDGARDVVLVLAPTADGWRVSDVRPYDP